MNRYNVRACVEFISFRRRGVYKKRIISKSIETTTTTNEGIEY